MADIVIPEGFYFVTACVLAGVLGLCVGSFLNVVIYRIPREMSIVRPASHCPKCGYKLKWYDNIPIISYCILGGKCRSCKAHISFRYTLVETANCILWIFSVYWFKNNFIYALIAMAICSLSLCIFCIDYEHMLIFDRFQIAILVFGIAAIFFDHTVWYDHLIGGAVGLLVFMGVAVIMGRILGREALGGGDVKLAAVTGLFLGWQKLIIMMLVASIGGSIIMLIIRIKTKEDKEVCFGPFLTVGLLTAMFFGTNIIDRYLTLLGV